MFSPSVQIDRRRLRKALGISLALHGLLIYLIIRRPAPLLVRPSAVRSGEHGSSLLPVYIPRRGSEDALELKKQVTAPSDVLHFSRPQARPKSQPDERLLASKQPKSRTVQPSRAAAAGSAYGSLWEGAIGSEIKPALPVFGPQPSVAPSELSPGLEGDVIVELTINERGVVVNEILLHGLGRSIDEKVLEVLQDWRFKPATKDGVAIASKQDVYFHFRAS